LDIFGTIRFLDSSCIFDNTIPINRSKITDVDSSVRWTQNASDGWVDGIWPVDRWCRSASGVIV